MTESEAIKWQKQIGEVFKGFPLDIEEKMNDSCDMAMQALEKHIPKKPILKHDVSVMHINRGNQPHEWKRLESDNWHCSECDSFVGERVYVLDMHHDQGKKKYCYNCGQKLDWSDTN